MDTAIEHVAESCCDSIALTIARFKAVHEAATPQVEQAMERYAERTKRDAITGLNRPSWLLSRVITSKIKTYKDGQIFWNVVGPKKETRELNDPGVYWKYHEFGWRPDGRAPSVTPRFLRTAKERNRTQLVKDVRKAYEEIQELMK